MRYFLLVTVLLGVSACSVNHHLKKGKEALSVYNYFDAINHFEKGLKKNHFRAHYGLAVIYYRNDNPFHNLEHAYYHLTQADSILNHLNWEKGKYKKIDSTLWNQRFDSLMQNIATAEYIHVQIIDQQELYQRFIHKFSEAKEQEVAIRRRDQLALEKAYETGNSDAFLSFMQQYPNSAYWDEAKRQYEQNLYNEQTNRQSLLSYIQFIRNYPKSPYVNDAEDKIYQIETQYETLNSYDVFIQNYPDNHNVEKAWKKLFSLYMKNDYSKDKLQAFSEDYPDYPFKNELQETLALAELQLLPFEEKRLWGFIDTDGTEIIAPQYDWVEQFSEGLALVGKNDKTGYINKRGTWQIQNIEDGLALKGGVAVVEIEGKYGVIDRSGNTVLEPKYDDIGQFSEGLFYILKGDKYGYANNNGVMMIAPKFDFASDFENGIATVQIDQLWGVIDKKGSFLIRPKYEKLQVFNDSSYIVERDGIKGVLTLKEDTLIPFQYQVIVPEQEHRALVQNEEGVGYFNMITKRQDIPCKYEPYLAMNTLGAFRNKHAAVQVKGKIGFIDTTGKKVIPSIFKLVGYFSDRIPIIKEELWGYCDEEADLQIDYQYDIAESFVDDNAIVQIDPFFGVIDKKGTPLMEIKYESIERINTNVFIVKEKGRYGLRSIDKEIIPVAFNKYVVIEDRFIRFDKSDDFVYYDSKTGNIIKR